MNRNNDPVELPGSVAPGCPFCGAGAQIQPWHGGGPRKRMVGCGNDSCAVQPSVSGSSRSWAIAKWSKRA